jgi:hypothetical protein
MAGMEWNIKERSEVCSVTSTPFQEGDIFYTVLLEEKCELMRHDMSVEAWELRKESLRPLSFWRSVFKIESQAGHDALGKEDAESELRRLLALNDPANKKVCYLLALLLERKRILRAREHTNIEGKSTVIYEHVQTQETFIIPEVHFKLNEVEAVQNELKTSSRIFFKSPTDSSIAI